MVDVDCYRWIDDECKGSFSVDYEDIGKVRSCPACGAMQRVVYERTYAEGHEYQYWYTERVTKDG